LLDWIKLLVAEDIDPAVLRSQDPKKTLPILHGALLKNEQDVHLFEQLVFLTGVSGRNRTRRARQLLLRAAQRWGPCDPYRVPDPARSVARGRCLGLRPGLLLSRPHNAREG